MKKLLLHILLVTLLFACDDNKESKEPSNDISSEEAQVNQDSLLRVRREIQNDIFPLVNYEQVVIANREALNKLLKEFEDTKENFAANKTFITLNRKARHYMRVGDTVLVPDSIFTDMRAYSVFPMYYHGAKDLPKLVMVSNLYQAYACYENGVQVRFASCNTGKEKTQTYPGRYSAVWKQVLKRSSIDSNWVLPFTINFQRYAGSAFHQFTMPGYPASHSCIRQFEDDAEWLFNWIKTADYDSTRSPIPHSGTPIILIDVFDYRRPKTGPWLTIANNKSLILELPEEPMQVEEALIPISQVPHTSRGILPNKDRYKYAEDSLRARGVIREGVVITESVDFNKQRREKRKLEAQRKRKEELEKSNQELENNIEPANPPN